MSNSPERPLDAQPCGQVFIIDDDADILRGLRGLVELEGHQCQTFGSASAFLEAFNRIAWNGAEPSCILCDVKMPDTDGLTLQSRLKAQADVPLILMSGTSGASEAVAGLRAGAVHFLIKPMDASELLAAIAEALALSRARKNLSGRREQRQQLWARLTPREAAVARLVARGTTNLGAALQLGITERTVKFHRQRVFEKLGLAGVPGLVRFLEEHDRGG
jgi:FixJ family two-component response regulator